MLRIVRFSINPSRISFWRLVTIEAPKALYSTLRQEMTLPEFKYVDVSLSRMKVISPFVLTLCRIGRHQPNGSYFSWRVLWQKSPRG